MDLASLVGLAVCLTLCIFGIVFNASNMSVNFGKISNFIDVPSILITIGGAFMCVMAMCKSIPAFLGNLGSIKLAIKKVEFNEQEAIKQIIDLSNVARKEGLLALEEASSNVTEPFLKKGIMLIVDGTEPELVSGILEQEISAISDRHKKVISFWEDTASMGPAWGMIGTLIGLINMLREMDPNDSSTLGPNMATALITTFYGSLIANWICTPVASKLKMNNDIELSVKMIMYEGILSIQAGENPRVIEEKLKSFIAPKERAGLETSEGE